MRGQKLFNDVIKNDTELRKGRNDALLLKRNDCMLARYYYYGHFKEKCFEEIIQLLVADFFISPLRISRIVQENSEKIKELKDKGVSVYLLQQNYPQYRW